MRLTSWSFGAASAITVVGLLISACAPAAPAAPTAAPAAPAAAPKPTEAPKPAAAPTTAPAAAAAAAPKPTEAPKPAAPAPTTAPAAAAAPKPAAAAFALPKPEKSSLQLSYQSIETNSMAMYLANELGLFKKYGFDNVELTFNESGKATTALVAGQIDAGMQGVSPAISSLATDAPMLVVAMATTKLSDGLFASSETKTPADLKGKTVGISQFGGTSHASALLLLQSIGLTDRDVTIVQIGGNPARVAALKAGSIQASPLDMSSEADMRGEGFNLLANSLESDLEFPRSGVVVLREYAEKNPNTVMAIVAATWEAQNAMVSQHDRAVEAFMKMSQLSNREQVDKMVRDAQIVNRNDMRWGKEGFELAKQVLASQDPSINDVDLDKVYTTQFLDRLQQMGFVEAIGGIRRP